MRMPSYNTSMFRQTDFGQLMLGSVGGGVSGGHGASGLELRGGCGVAVADRYPCAVEGRAVLGMRANHRGCRPPPPLSTQI